METINTSNKISPHSSKTSVKQEELVAAHKVISYRDLGYHESSDDEGEESKVTTTENSYNKRLVKLSDKLEAVNPVEGLGILQHRQRMTKLEKQNLVLKYGNKAKGLSDMLKTKMSGFNNRHKLTKEQQEVVKGEIHNTTTDLIESMLKALHLDHAALDAGVAKAGPAVHRVRLLPKVEVLLTKKRVRQEFLEQNGLDILAQWITPYTATTKTTITTRSTKFDKDESVTYPPLL